MTAELIHQKNTDLSDVALTPSVLQLAYERMLSLDVSLPAALQQIIGLNNSDFLKLLSEKFHYKAFDASSLQGFEAVFNAISLTECSQRQLLIAKLNNVTWLLLTNPFDEEGETWGLNRAAELGGYVEVGLLHADDLQAYLVLQERSVRAMDDLDVHANFSSDEDVAAVITLATISDDTSPIVKLVNSTIYDALKIQASDIHLECDAGQLHILYRIDGVLVPIKQVAGQFTAEQVISRIKVMAELDIAERRIPQDGRFKVRVNKRDIDFRVSIMPNIFGEDAVLRLLDRQSLTDEAHGLSLNDLGLDDHAIKGIRRLAEKPHGMLLVTGPTGSGKTTTLYAAITEINTGRDKIITIEDPVEYRLPRVLQIPVNEKKGLSFARGLRSILRHDPDKIMVGEIRDDETAQIAVQASLTGHLVLTTVHANNVFDVLGRFLHMGVDSYSFSSALNGIVAQRLLRMNCPVCSVVVEPSNEDLSSCGLTMEEVVGWSFKKGLGCGNCRGVGYKGRKAAAEVLIMNDALRELIAERSPMSALKDEAKRNGLKSMRITALKWVEDGFTTLEEVRRVIG